MKIVYMGTPEFSRTCLNELIINNFGKEFYVKDK